jgi:hypothetical protein
MWRVFSAAAYWLLMGSCLQNLAASRDACGGTDKSSRPALLFSPLHINVAYLAVSVLDDPVEGGLHHSTTGDVPTTSSACNGKLQARTGVLVDNPGSCMTTAVPACICAILLRTPCSEQSL